MIVLDLLRNCSAPLTWYFATKETRHGITTTHPEFRAEAFRIALTSGLPRKQVAADLGVDFSTLNGWIRQDLANPAKPTAQTDKEKELAELRKEMRMLREEREVSKLSRIAERPVDVS